MDVKHHLQLAFEREERWWCWESCRKPEQHHLRLAFGCEGGGGGGRWAKWTSNTTSSSRLNAREVVIRKNPTC